MRRPGVGRRRFLQVAGSVVGSSFLSGATEASVVQQSAENWDFYEDFEQYSTGTKLENIRGWEITNDASGEGFEIESAYASEGGEKAISPVAESGLFQIDAVNTGVESWQYPESGFEFRALLSTEGNENVPHAGVAGIGVGIEFDNHPYRGTHITFYKPDGRVNVGSIEADTYEIKIKGRRNQEIVGSVRPIGNDSWESFSTQTDFEGEITGVYINTNNGGQMDSLRLRKTTDDESSFDTPTPRPTEIPTQTPTRPTETSTQTSAGVGTNINSTDDFNSFLNRFIIGLLSTEMLVAVSTAAVVVLLVVVWNEETE